MELFLIPAQWLIRESILEIDRDVTFSIFQMSLRAIKQLERREMKITRLFRIMEISPIGTSESNYLFLA